MSSVLRYTASNKELPTPDGLVVLTYSLAGDDVVVPLKFNKQSSVLDFDFETGFTASTSINSSTTAYVRGQSFGANQNVLGIGPNLISWLETTGGADAGTVEVYELPIVCRVNQLQINQEPNSVNAMSTSSLPFSFEQSEGTSANSYFGTYIFKKPLVVRYLNGGSIQYRVFTTQTSFQT
jgi:hypothetical protein